MSMSSPSLCSLRPCSKTPFPVRCWLFGQQQRSCRICQFVKHLMFKDQVYNTVGRDRGQLSPNTDTFRRLTRRIHHNMGLLNTSRSSNHSSSFRMRRTELSGDRYNASRDKDQTSNQISGLNSQEINESRGQIPKKIGSMNDLSSRRLRYEPAKIMPMQQTGAKRMVENLYMLNNNQRPNEKGRERSNRPQHFEPQSPRTYNSPAINDDRRRDYNSKQRNEQRSGSHSRQSRLVQRQRSKDQSRLRSNKNAPSRDRRYNEHIELEGKRKYQDMLIKKLEEKYLENIYELKSPRAKKEGRKPSEKQIQINERVQHNKKDNTGTKNMNLYYFQQTQVSSTSGGTVGVKTLPETSKVETISQASLPVNSVASQKDIASKGSISPRLHQKNSAKLERTKEKTRNESREKKKQPQSSRISLKYKASNAQQQKRPKAKEKVVDEREDEVLLLGSVFLPVESKREEGRQWAEDILQRIILHLECLNIIADYTKQFRKMYENTEQWEVLIFLSYKKFYIERTKIGSILKAPSIKKEIEESKLMTGCENPFILPYSKISEEELVRFRGSRECLALRHELETQDSKIRNALRGLYNLYIEKSGQHVNMLDCDNFSQEIYKLMLEELEGIAENLQEPALVEPTKLRMGKIIRSGLLIAYLNAKYVKNFAQVLLHEDTIKIGKRQTLRQDCAADIFLQQFKRVFS